MAVDHRSPGSGSGSVTRGFLFADLRGYTTFTETRGAEAAANLLARYRTLVRSAVDRFAGAEIRTEGDSFYVVFGSVSAAVRCGLAIVDAAAADASGHPVDPIQVGIGIHAGETVETGEGYVGTPVNLAARICSQARAGEVLVSDTVRALTQTVLSGRFDPRGRRQLKGIAEHVALFAAIPAAADAHDPSLARRSRWGRGSRRARGAVLVGVGGLAVAGAVVGWAVLRPSGLPPGPWRVAVALPLTGELGEQGPLGGAPMRDAIRLAIDEANAEGGVGGARIELVEHDSASEEMLFDEPAPDPLIERIVADPRVVAVIGPWGSPLARHQLPLANAAGLLQCSPSATDPGLTKPRDGALDLRDANPDRVSFVRVTAADDINATAMAAFAFDDLGISRVLVVDDTDVIGRAVGDDFERAYTARGGEVVRRALNEGADPSTVLDILSSGPGAPGAVFFGGFTDTGAPELRRAMAEAGHADVPFLSWDGIFDGPGSDPGTFIGQAGEAAAGAYLAHSGVASPRSDFVDRFRAAYGARPSEYTAAAYACAEVILDALRAVAETGPSAESLREALRAHVVDPEHEYETVLGGVAFDVNGDSTSQFVTLYRVEPSAAQGAGDWIIHDTRFFAPTP